MLKNKQTTWNTNKEKAGSFPVRFGGGGAQPRFKQTAELHMIPEPLVEEIFRQLQNAQGSPRGPAGPGEAPGWLVRGRAASALRSGVWQTKNPSASQPGSAAAPPLPGGLVPGVLRERAAKP